MAGPAGACTIVSKNYLAQARALAESLRATHPGLPFHVLLVDRVEGRFDPAAEPFEVLELERLPVPDPRRWCFQYNVTELNTAAKPYFLAHLFAAHGYRQLVYLDPDILVLGDLEPLFDLLELHSIVLTPHMLGPVADGKKPTEKEIL